MILSGLNNKVLDKNSQQEKAKKKSLQVHMNKINTFYMSYAEFNIFSFDLTDHLRLRLVLEILKNILIHTAFPFWIKRYKLCNK